MTAFVPRVHLKPNDLGGYDVTLTLDPLKLPIAQVVAPVSDSPDPPATTDLLSTDMFPNTDPVPTGTGTVTGTVPVSDPVPSTPAGADPFPGWLIPPPPNAVGKVGYGSGLLDVGNPQTYEFSAPQNTIHAHRIRFDPAIFTGNHAIIIHNQATSNAFPRDVWVSAVPGGRKIGVNAMQGGYLGAKLRFAFDGSGTFMNDATNLAKGADYWLNVKAHDSNTPVDYLISVSAQP